MGGSLPEQEIREIINLSAMAPQDITTFIETGTYHADTTIEASKIFDKVYSIELVEALHQKSKERCKDIENITLYLGNTLDHLPSIVKSLEGNVIFFIDAHQSGPDTSHIGKNVPCLEEIDTILTNLSSECHGIFIIDDVRFWKGSSTPAWDWADISLVSVEGVFKKHNVSILKKFLRNDRFMIKF